jgi:hypothetical protein
MIVHYIPVGTSEPQDFALRNDGEPFNGTDFTVELEIFRKNADGTFSELEYPPTVAWLTQAAGTVRNTGVETLIVGNYFVRYKVTDSFLNVGFFPNGEKASIWKVVPIPGQ